MINWHNIANLKPIKNNKKKLLKKKKNIINLRHFSAVKPNGYV